MKSLLLCDSRKFKETALLCQKYKAGIEAQSFFDPNYLTLNPTALNDHLVALEGISLRSIHGPFWDMCPASFDSLIQDATRIRFEWAFDCADKLNAKHIILHHNGYPDGVFTNPKSKEAWLNRNIQFWKEFLVDKDKTVTVHLENFLEGDPELMFSLIEAVGSDNLDINLDIGHVNFSSDLSVVHWIKRLNKYIGYVHIHDNLGVADDHECLGKGNLPLVEIFEALEKYSPNAIWAIENGEIEASLEWLKERGFLDF